MAVNLILSYLNIVVSLCTLCTWISVVGCLCTAYNGQCCLLTRWPVHIVWFSSLFDFVSHSSCLPRLEWLKSLLLNHIFLWLSSFCYSIGFGLYCGLGCFIKYCNFEWKFTLEDFCHPTKEVNFSEQSGWNRTNLSLKICLGPQYSRLHRPRWVNYIIYKLDANFYWMCLMCRNFEKNNTFNSWIKNFAKYLITFLVPCIFYTLNFKPFIEGI